MSKFRNKTKAEWKKDSSDLRRLIGLENTHRITAVGNFRRYRHMDNMLLVNAQNWTVIAVIPIHTRILRIRENTIYLDLLKNIKQAGGRNLRGSVVSPFVRLNYTVAEDMKEMLKNTAPTPPITVVD